MKTLRRLHHGSGVEPLPGRAWRLRKRRWDGEMSDMTEDQRVSLVVYMASCMELPAPSRNEMMLRFNIGREVADSHIAHLFRLGAINRDLRVLPGWKERLMA